MHDNLRETERLLDEASEMCHDSFEADRVVQCLEGMEKCLGLGAESTEKNKNPLPGLASMFNAPTDSGIDLRFASRASNAGNDLSKWLTDTETRDAAVTAVTPVVDAYVTPLRAGYERLIEAHRATLDLMKKNPTKHDAIEAVRHLDDVLREFQHEAETLYRAWQRALDKESENFKPEHIERCRRELDELFRGNKQIQ